MAGARTAAMGFNRIVDRHIDARNPRTAGRELPAGEVSLRARLGPDPGQRRRCSWAPRPRSARSAWRCRRSRWRCCSATRTPSASPALCHLFLGLAIAAGPGGAWIAVRGDFGWRPASG